MRIYRKIKGKLMVSEDDGVTWEDLFKHLEEEHNIKQEDLAWNQKQWKNWKKHGNQ